MAQRDEDGDSAAFDCQHCGACCAYSAEWPRFTLEDDAEIARIPAALLTDNGSGMRCQDDRCLALTGKVGQGTACGIYEVRPLVCRDCLPGDDACLMARDHHGL